MSEETPPHQPPPMPPAGWYTDPQGLAQQRWWSGHAWTAQVQPYPAPMPTPKPALPYVTPIATPALEANGELATESSPGRDIAERSDASPAAESQEEAAVRFRDRPIYWSNLFRWRFWQFTIFGPLVLAILAALLFYPLFYVIFFLGVPLMGWYWLHVQMACRACGRILAVTKLTGELEVCKHCHTPTDLALAQQA